MKPRQPRRADRAVESPERGFDPRLGDLFLVVATVLAYGWAIARCGYIWDDDFYVTGNGLLRSLAGLSALWTRFGHLHGGTVQYYPVTFTAFWLQYHLWGPHAWGYHAINALLHGVNAVLVRRLLSRLGVPGAFLAAAVFALHPVHVESVAWITELKNCLSGTFYLLSLGRFLRFFGLVEGETGEGRPSEYLTGLILFACALGAKTVTATLPAAILLLLWWRRGAIRPRDAAAMAPLLALGAAAGAVTSRIEHTQVGAAGRDWALTAAQRCVVAGRALWFYAAKLAWPATLSFNYARWSVPPGLSWQAAYPLAVLALLGALWGLRGRLGRGPLASVLFFAGTLTPALGFVNVYPLRYSFVADHFQYLASLGLIALFAAGAARAGRAASAALLVVLAILTFRRCAAYESLETLWSDTIAQNPASWMAENNLGNLRVDQGRLEEGIAHFRRALEISPGYAEAQSNWGRALFLAGRPEEAIPHLDEALRLGALSPVVHNNAVAHDNLGLALLRQNKVDAAIAQFRESAAVEPSYAEAHTDLAAALIQQGRGDLALPEAQEALRLDPYDANARCNLALILSSAGRRDEAVAQYREAIRLKPNLADAHNNLGVLLGQQNRPAEAVAEFREALRLKPGLGNAHFNLGLLLRVQGELDAAIAQFQEAVSLDPTLEPARRYLQDALKLRTHRNATPPQS